MRYPPLKSVKSNTLDNTYIGTGVIITQGKPNKPLRIGKNVAIGTGAVISKDIPDNTTVLLRDSKPIFINNQV